MEAKEKIYEVISKGFNDRNVDRPIVGKMVKVMTNDFESFMDWSLFNNVQLALFLTLFKLLTVAVFFKSKEKYNKKADGGKIFAVVFHGLYSGRENFFNPELTDQIIEFLEAVKIEGDKEKRMHLIDMAITGLYKLGGEPLDQVADICLKEIKKLDEQINKGRLYN